MSEAILDPEAWRATSPLESCRTLRRAASLCPGSQSVRQKFQALIRPADVEKMEIVVEELRRRRA